MTKFRAKLTFILILLIGCSMLIAGIFMAKVLENSHIKSLQDNMERELQVITATGDWNRKGTDAELISYYSVQAKRLKEATNERLTYVRADGKVLGDSDQRPEQMDNHLNRPEIVSAAANGIGYITRYSDTLKENMLYAAIPVKNEAQETTGFLRISMSLEQVGKSIRSLWYFLISGLIILFLIAGIVSYRIAKGITHPIEKMTKVAQQITNMNYESRVPAYSNDEVGQLGQAINRMSESLQQQMARIQENERRLQGVMENMMSGIMMIDREERIMLLNPAAEYILGFSSQELLGKKYNEAKQQYEFTKLIQECIETQDPIRDEMVFYYPAERILDIHLSPIAHEDEEWSGVLIVIHDITAVRRLERMRSEFVANVSHELKTPIAAVKGFAETLLAGALNDKETAVSFLQIIFDESERLNRLIGDILELSKIESKRIPMNFSPIYLPEFLERSLSVLRKEAEKKHIELSMLVDDDIYIEADEDRLRQIIINLLSNGIAYTHDGGKVKVRVEPLDMNADGDYERLRLIVSDTGMGIPKKDLPRIFERFYRVDKARSRSSGGTGLGLSIVKHLVELHKGTIRVDSEVGVGTRFTIELPVIH
ncbi:two-component system phosphate regulon sensor histidine kinase PhoR [Paenibacillus sp. V4I3]|uniref:two-component system histidine kinase PnpS n=1 Tax=unclassified Paenibacillus TaxID=185978 RepID=UPI0027892479|nr:MULTISPECIES: ATP-binding protein [unclassified Paenibacillus]MDQ0873856.1 two-component system phosphate regulon sensor histidine kinase PhoR [Paenibacillus sp. V4I3]MDQ0890279.1 two-component system phosphate regulon sensor histidine kinase PhoR [Paenibacillus sp. V4I9]